MGEAEKDCIGLASNRPAIETTPIFICQNKRPTDGGHWRTHTLNGCALPRRALQMRLLTLVVDDEKTKRARCHYNDDPERDLNRLEHENLTGNGDGTKACAAGWLIST
jgi:hypothetical protein